MKIGWSKLYSYLTRKPSQYSAVGIEYNLSGLVLCAFKFVDGEHVLTLHHQFALANWQTELKEFVEEHELGSSPTVITFSTKKYQLLQIDRPQVPDEELAMALQWSIKDLVMTQDEMYTDYLDLPAQTTGANKVNVVAIAKEELFQVCSGVIESGLKINSVSAEEVSNCDLVDDSSDAVLLVFQEPGAEVCLNIVKNRKMYFSRKIRGYENLSTFTEEELKMGTIDNLSVELQRSMDFFEGQLRQAPIKHIRIQLDNLNEAAIAKMIGDAMLVNTELLNPMVNCAEGVSVDKSLFAAIGAASAILNEEVDDSEQDEAAA